MLQFARSTSANAGPRGQFLHQAIEGALRDHTRGEDFEGDRLCLIIGHIRRPFSPPARRLR